MIDPTHLTALHSLDFGSVYSADGREHPLTAFTPVYQMEDSGAVSSDVQAPLPSSSSGASTTTPGGTLTPANYWPDWLTPKVPTHIGARVVVGLIAIGIILIVALRLTLRD
jgi:hypothetical protein